MIPAERSQDLKVGTVLYGLEPRGLGGPARESLRGYLVRLAAEHALRPRDLVARVLVQLEPSISPWAYASFFARHALTIDGIGVYAETFARALGGGTGRRDLASLSMLPWASLLPPNGKSLLARRPRWCPECLRAGWATPDGAHWQLRWSLAAVSHCSDHGIPLHDRCGHCGRLQPALPRHPTIGYCDHCLSPLFDLTSTNSQEQVRPTPGGLETEQLIDELVAIQDGLARDPKESWLSFIDEAVASLGKGQRAALCRRMGFQPRAFNAWLQRQDRVSIGAIVRVCSALGCGARRVFGEEPRHLSSLVPQQRAGARRVRHDENVRSLSARLLHQAVSQNAPPSLRDVASAAGVSRGYLRYWFDDQVAALTGARRRRVEHLRQARTAQRLELLRVLVTDVVASEQFPGRKLIESAARRHGFSLLDEGMLEIYRRIVADLLQAGRSLEEATSNETR